LGKKPVTATAAAVLLFLNALIWFFFAVLAGAGFHPALPESRTVQWVMAILAFGCACVLVALIILLGKRVRSAYYLTTGLLVLLMILTVTDDVGWVDLAYLTIVMAPLILLIKDRSWYLRRSA
jgi:hypothetical protein